MYLFWQGLHRLWKNKLIRDIKPNSKMKLIDVAGGTGINKFILSIIRLEKSLNFHLILKRRHCISLS